MRVSFTQEQMEDLLTYIGVQKLTQWKGSKIQGCCPVHGEENPSFGVNIDYCPDGEPDAHIAVCHCFSCGFSSTIPWLLVKTIPNECPNIKEAEKWIKDRYEVSLNYITNENGEFYVPHFDDIYERRVAVERHVTSRTALAPFKSGKETYQYFFDRGFDKSDMKKFMIGRDVESETITIPAYWEDGQLAGVIGRYIDPSRPKNSRYKIYDFPKGTVLFPLNYLRAVNDTLIGVEGMFDAMMLHKWGFPNVCAMMGGTVTRQQADLIASKCSKFITLFDADDGGEKAIEMAKKRLKDRVVILEPTYYPKQGKDPCEWGEKETIKVIKSAKYAKVKSLPRIQ